MSLTIAIVNYNYAQYLEQCISTCLKFSDLVHVYDDCSTDNSIEIIKSFPEVKLTQNIITSGSPVWGSSLSILDCETTHLAWVDSDNFIIRKPEETDYDYVHFNTLVCNKEGQLIDYWDTSYFSTDYMEILQFLYQTITMPFSWAGVWNMNFLKGKEWKAFKAHPSSCTDFRTAIEFMSYPMTINHIKEPWLVYRDHEENLTKKNRRDLYLEEAKELVNKIYTEAQFRNMKEKRQKGF